MPWQCDQMGHMNSRHIYAVFDDATAAFMSFIGGPLSEAGTNGLGWADVHQAIDFRREIHDGEIITVHSSMLDLGRTSISFVHSMTTDSRDALAAELHSKTVRFDLSARCAVPLEAGLRRHVESLVEKDTQ